LLAFARACQKLTTMHHTMSANAGEGLLHHRRKSLKTHAVLPSKACMSANADKGTLHHRRKLLNTRAVLPSKACCRLQTIVMECKNQKKKHTNLPWSWPWQRLHWLLLSFAAAKVDFNQQTDKYRAQALAPNTVCLESPCHAGMTDSHRQPQTATDSHRRPQTATDSHRQPQAATGSHRQPQCTCHADVNSSIHHRATVAPSVHGCGAERGTRQH